MVADEVLDLVIRVHRLTGIAPEAVEHVVLHETLLEVPVIHISDLELPAVRRSQPGEDTPHGGVIEVDAGHRVLARRYLGLLDDPLDPAVAVELSHPKVPEVLAVGQMREHDPRALLLLLESVDAGTDRSLEDVVPEQHDCAITANEFLGEP